LLVSTAFAQSGPSKSTSSPAPVKQTIVVTGSYEPLPLKESDRSIDVIETGQLPLLFRNAYQALDSDPSIDLQQRAPGVQGDLSMRGGSFGQTLVLIDGLRVDDAQSGHHNLDLPIPFESIDRVEVLHGSGSTLYGSDAVGGAVNFITGAPRYTELRVGSAVGNFGTNSQDGSASLLAKSYSEQLTFTRDFSTGFMPDRDYRSVAGAAETRITTKAGVTDLLFGTSDRPFGANQFYGNFNSWERTKGWFVGANQQLGDSTDLAFGYRRHTDEFILLRNNPSVYENNHITQSWQGALRRHDNLKENVVASYGAEGFSDVIDSSNLGSHGRIYGAAYGNIDLRAIKRFSLSVGGREEFGDYSEFSPTVAAGYWISSSWRLRGSASHAFRLPTYTDLYYHDPANLGNPSLKPERAWDFEGGTDWDSGRPVSLHATVFQLRERNGIDYVRSNPTDLWRATNIDNLNFTGVELLTRVRVGDRQRLEFGYVNLHGSQQQPAAVQSRYIFNYAANLATAAWTGAAPRGIQCRAQLRAVQRLGRDAYPVVDFSAYRSFGRISPYVQVTNASNTGYEEIPDVRMPGRLAIVGFELALRRSTPQTQK
jgi:outer membrane cobalamin receptor